MRSVDPTEVLYGTGSEAVRLSIITDGEIVRNGVRVKLKE